MKKSLEKSKKVLEEKRKMVKRKICIKKTNTFTRIDMNFVQEQLKIRSKKLKKKQKINVKKPHVNRKPPTRNGNSVLKKTRSRMNYEWIWKTIEKDIRFENRKKTLKVKVTLPQCEQKTTSEKANFCANTVLSLYFKIRAEKFHAAKILEFLVRFLFQRDQNDYSNLTSNIMKMCNFLFV